MFINLQVHFQHPTPNLKKEEFLWKTRITLIQAQEDLRTIVEKLYGDPELNQKLAEYKGIFDPGLLVVNQIIETPSRDELLGIPATAVSFEPGRLNPPNGLHEILAAFGDPLIGEESRSLPPGGFALAS